MKFFIPKAENKEMEAEIYQAIRRHVSDICKNPLSPRRVRLLRCQHEGEWVDVEVGKVCPFNSEIVVAILYEPRKTLYYVCTPTRGFLEGVPLQVGKREVRNAEDFDE
jgi:hypothetical protein